VRPTAVLEQRAGPEVDTDNDEGDGEGGHDEDVGCQQPQVGSVEPRDQAQSSVHSQRHCEPEQEQLRADAHFEVAPERKPAAHRDELAGEPDSGQHLDDERGDPNLLERRFECAEDARIAASQRGWEHGDREHQMTARPYTRSEDMQRQQQCAQDVTREVMRKGMCGSRTPRSESLTQVQKSQD
jgi:hypothetical protein